MRLRINSYTGIKISFNLGVSKVFNAPATQATWRLSYIFFLGTTKGIFQMQTYVFNINTGAYPRHTWHYKNDELIINHVLPIFKTNMENRMKWRSVPLICIQRYKSSEKLIFALSEKIALLYGKYCKKH